MLFSTSVGGKPSFFCARSAAPCMQRHSVPSDGGAHAAGVCVHKRRSGALLWMSPCAAGAESCAAAAPCGRPPRRTAWPRGAACARLHGRPPQDATARSAPFIGGPATLQVESLFIVQLAAHRALTSQARGSLATRSLHSELVFNFSGSKHVSHLVAGMWVTWLLAALKLHGSCTAARQCPMGLPCRGLKSMCVPWFPCQSSVRWLWQQQRRMAHPLLRLNACESPGHWLQCSCTDTAQKCPVGWMVAQWATLTPHLP